MIYGPIARAVRTTIYGPSTGKGRISLEKFAIGIGVAVLTGGMVGLILQRVLAEHFHR